MSHKMSGERANEAQFWMVVVSNLCNQTDEPECILNTLFQTIVNI